MRTGTAPSMRAKKLALLDHIEKSDGACKDVLLIVHNRQTMDELQEEATHHWNGVGFGVFDAKLGSSLATQIKGGRGMTDKQMVCVRHLARRYAGQVAKLLQEQESKGTEVKDG